MEAASLTEKLEAIFGGEDDSKTEMGLVAISVWNLVTTIWVVHVLEESFVKMQ